MIYLLFPTRSELDPLAGFIVAPQRGEVGGRERITGMLGGHKVAAVVSGMGQVNTAQTVAAILEGGHANLLILGGCAGAFKGSGLSVGDVVVATEEIYADLGVVTPEGWSSLEDIGLPLIDRSGVRYFNRFPLDRDLVERALAGPAKLAPKVLSGTFLTVSTISGTKKRGDELYVRFGALCENMEGAAAAQVAALYGVPFMEVRGISNMVEDRNRDGWDVTTASANCARVIEGVLKNLGEQWT